MIRQREESALARLKYVATEPYSRRTARWAPTITSIAGQALIDGTDLRLSYGATTALAGANFLACAGESVAIVGSSGSGKTSLLRCLAGLQHPTSGSVLYRGEDLYALSDRQRSQIRLSHFGFVFQSAELIPELTLLENIALPVELNGERRRRSLNVAAAWAERLGISDAAQRRPTAVSGGQRQRAAVARAMAIEPAVVFADEPTGSLDSENRNRVVDILLESCTTAGALLVLVTHDRHIGARVRRVVEVADGRTLSVASKMQTSGPRPR